MLREAEAQDLEQLNSQWRSRRVSAPLGVTSPTLDQSGSKFMSGTGLAAVFAFLVGTGGLLTASYICQRDARGYRFNVVDYKSRRHEPIMSTAITRTPLQNLSHIRETFGSSRTQLASYLGVSRQTVYNWESGDPIAEHNERVLEQMAIAADVLVAGGLTNKRELKRPLSDGKCLLDLVRNGAAGASSAQSLLAMLEHETVQRARLTARLRDRMKRPVDYSEVGIPSLDERV